MLRLIKIFLAILALLPFPVLGQEIELISRKESNLEVIVKIDSALNASAAARNHIKKLEVEGIKAVEEEAKAYLQNKVQLTSTHHVTYTAEWFSDTFLSLQGRSETYTGGAYTMVFYKAHILDLKKNKPIKLSEIIDGLNQKKSLVKAKFMDFTIRGIAFQKLTKNLKRDPNEDEIKKHIQEDIKLSLEAIERENLFKNFVFVAEKNAPITAIRLLFGNFDVGSDEGEFEITLPLALFKDNIKPKWRAYFEK